MASELKRCPFCNSDRITVHNIRDGQQAVCKDCGSHGKPVFHGPKGPEATWGEAVAAWNTRPAPAATVTGLETIGYVLQSFVDGEGADYNEIFRTVREPENWTATVTRSQAEELLAAEQAKAAEKERLRFEGDLDKWMKIIGAGITGYQPEAYTLMDLACQELVRLRADNAAQAARINELEEVHLDAADAEPGEHQEILAALEAHNSGEEQ
ncbi:Lar family restriction alleviation protein [Ochrobactrum sp. 3-3]|uniref:Lar family restriction alleviation protein n=1 Tax=Ochrobactrum sp. 3-3 TaxID=1830124 RepID=UPI0013B40DD4|nr:Lar family restriction alleviation protein [Ochrobactrum sp. 3-3]